MRCSGEIIDFKEVRWEHLDLGEHRITVICGILVVVQYWFCCGGCKHGIFLHELLSLVGAYIFRIVGTLPTRVVVSNI